ncbi:MAG TPA: SDR family NAD(P)-dependent oxidoreductase, partial [Ktedonobacterales bacterium]|nr:SDR family NAD(P)-dependent oxidoreductase [Ktedonobacterales bacterium]
RAQLETNLFGVVNVTKAALPVLHQQRSGHILQISSIGGRVGKTPGLGAYQAAKFAIEGYSDVLAEEVAPLGIKVIIVEPGGFRTHWTGGAAGTTVAVGPDYEQTVGAWVLRHAQRNGHETGDPAKAAQALIHIVDEPNPPRRLLLGSDAYRSAQADSQARIDEAQRWSQLTQSTDF